MKGSQMIKVSFIVPVCSNHADDITRHCYDDQLKYHAFTEGVQLQWKMKLRKVPGIQSTPGQAVPCNEKQHSNHIFHQMAVMHVCRLLKGQKDLTSVCPFAMGSKCQSENLTKVIVTG